MTSVKVSSIFNFDDWNSSVIVKLFNSFGKRKIEYVNPEKADILFIGPYDINSIKRKTVNFFLNRLKIKIFPNIDIYSFKEIINR